MKGIQGLHNVEILHCEHCREIRQELVFLLSLL